MSGAVSEFAASCLADADASPSRRTLDAWWQWLNSPVEPTRTTSRGRVLLISYQFPPTGGSGVQRPAKLAKYLPAFGWSVEVLTAGHDRFPWSDHSLIADLPDSLPIHRIAGREPACVARWLAASCASITGERFGRRVDDALHWRLTGWADRLGFEGGESLWVGPAARAAIRMHREKPFDAVISTGPPHFAHRVAMQVARVTCLPWLADVRDPLVSDFDRSGQSARQIRNREELETALVNYADAVVTTCPSFAWDLKERYPDRASRVHAITNGFDRDDIVRAMAASQPGADQEKSGECLFVAAGAFYGRRELARVIRPLEKLIRLHPQWRGRVRMIIAGSVDAEQRRAWQTQGPDWLSFAGYVDHNEAIRLVASAACSMVVVPACGHGRMSIPGKTFELLALPTHILGLAPAGSDTEHILRRAGGATVAPFENEPAVMSAMRPIIESHLAGELPADRDWRRVDAFDRRLVAERFADCLQSICGAATRRPQVDGQLAPAAEAR